MNRSDAASRAAVGMWLVAGLVLCVSLYLANTRYEARVAMTNSASETLYRNAVRNEALLKRASAVRRVRESVLRSLSLYASLSFPPDPAVGLVDTLVKSAAPLHVEITGLQPADQATSKKASREANVTPLNGLGGIAATVTVRGRFTDIVRLVQRLSRQRLPIDVQHVQISRVDQVNPPPLVESTIDVVAFHLVLAKVSDATTH